MMTATLWRAEQSPGRQLPPRAGVSMCLAALWTLVSDVFNSPATVKDDIRRIDVRNYEHMVQS